MSFERPDMARATGAVRHEPDAQYEAWLAAGAKPIITALGKAIGSVHDIDRERAEHDAAQQGPFEAPDRDAAALAEWRAGS